MKFFKDLPFRLVKWGAEKVRGYYSEENRQDLDLRMFVASFDPVYRRIFLVAIGGVAAAIVWLSYRLFSVLSGQVVGPGLLDLSAIIALAVAVWSVWSGFDSLGRASELVGQYRVGSADEEVGVERLKSLQVDGKDIAFKDLHVSADERRAEFALFNDPAFSSETFLRSEVFDTYLSGAEAVPFVEDNSLGRSLIPPDAAREDRRRRDQLSFTVAVAGQPQKRVLNDDKFGLHCRLAVPLEEVKVYKHGYFDALATNECFSSRIVVWQRGTPRPTGQIEERGRFDKYFPLVKDGAGYALRSLPVLSCANQVGITTLAVTTDGAVLFFRQNIKNLMASGFVVASGSGSVNYSDLELGRNGDDLLGPIRYAMARELLEEARERAEQGLLHACPPPDHARVAQIAQATAVTGFFRWINRAGKPEFVGVTKLDRSSEQMIHDNDEVLPLGDGQMWPVVQSLEDFAQVRDAWLPSLMQKIRIRTPETEVNLSAYVCLLRLCEIATYRSSENSEKKAVHDKISGLLFGI